MNKATIGANISKVLNRIEHACSTYGRNVDSVSLIAVSKTKPAHLIEYAAECGLQHFGENYLQEAVQKINELPRANKTWHFIGPIQSNKTRPIAQYFDWVHSVDRLKIATRISEQRPPDLPPINLCLQINVSLEDSKAGVTLEQVRELALAVQTLPNIRLRGLMALPRPTETVSEQRQSFALVRQCLQELQSDIPELDTLSMGMSQDLEAAIAEGATMLRVGTDLFGARDRS